jgi:c-di-GMP-binding flagellar brake protein YcgR
MAEPQASAPRPPAGAPSRYLEDRAEIQRALRVFRDRHVRVSLRFDGVAENFTARALDVTEDAVRLDDIKPRSGLSRMHQGESFSLTGRVEGVFVYAEDLRAAVATSDRGVPYFSFATPARLLYQQRRRSTRFRLPLRLTARGARVSLHRNGATLEGSILDISSGGCRATFIAPLGPATASGDRCELQIANLLSIVADVAIRHVSVDPGTGTVMCGLEFVQMDAADRQRLESFLRTIERLSNPQ